MCLLNSRKTSIKVKQLKIELRLFLAFFSLGPSDVDVFFAALSLPPERLGNVRRCAIFRTPSSSFWEAYWLRLRPARSLFTPGRPTNSENIVQDCEKSAAIIIVIARPDIMKSLWGKMGGGKKKNGGSSTTDQVKDRQKRLKQKFSQIESATKHILSKKLSGQYNTEYFVFWSSGY